MPCAFPRLACVALLGLLASGNAAAAVVVTDSVGNPDDRYLPFATGLVNVAQTGTVTVTNSTPNPVAVALTDRLQAPFNIADPGDCTRTLLPGTRCTLTITYVPVVAGSATDTLTLDLGGTPAVVNVFGRAQQCGVCVTDSSAPANDQSLRFGSAVAAGTTGTGTVTITNTSTSNASLLTVVLAEGLAPPFSLPNPETCVGVTLARNQSCALIVQFAPLARGAVSDSFTLDVGKDTDVGAAVVRVSVSGTPGLTNADFQVGKTANELVVQPGASGSDLSTFTLTVKNNGPDNAEPVVTDLLPAGLNFVSAAPGQGSYTAATGVWDVGTLARGATTTLQIATQATAGASGCLVNTATVAITGTGIDENPANDSTALVIGAPDCADLQIASQSTTSVDLGVAPANSPGCTGIKTVIRVRNNGPGAGTGVTLTVLDASPAPAADAKCDSAIANPLIPAAGQQHDLGAIPAGGSIDVTIADFAIGNNTTLDYRYQVSVAGAEPDPEVSNNTARGGQGFGPPGSIGNCFIATAAYGSWLEPEVVVLRQFRDRVLLTNAPGRAFVAWYYHVSPPVADYIRQREWLRALTRAGLTPLVYGIKYPWLPGLLVLVIGMGLGVRSRRSRAGPHLAR